MWEQLKRVVKPNGAIVMTASQPFTTTLIASNMKMFKYCWVWDKHIPRGFQVAKYRPMNRHEDVCVFGDGRIKYNPQMVERDKPVTVKNYSKKQKVSSNDIGKYNDETKSFTYTHRNPDTIIEGCWEANAGKVHPTQKPVALMEYLIKTYTNEGETVLDNCMGSGTTGVACVNTNRSFIGIELDPEYFNIAKQRIESAHENKAII
jgi:site-specific DNA-methyltransferase (adenine-specific)